MRILWTVLSFSLIATTGCATTHPGGSGQPALSSSERMQHITTLYAQATHEPVHAFRKPVRDERRRAQQALRNECDLWLAELPNQASPAALTGAEPTATRIAAERISELQNSLQGMAAAASRSDKPAMRTAYEQIVRLYAQPQ